MVSNAINDLNDLGPRALVVLSLAANTLNAKCTSFEWWWELRGGNYVVGATVIYNPWTAAPHEQCFSSGSYTKMNIPGICYAYFCRRFRRGWRPPPLRCPRQHRHHERDSWLSISKSLVESYTTTCTYMTK